MLFDNILSYDLFIFDFDGTILDTEKHHCYAWNKAIENILYNKNENDRNNENNQNKLSFQDYFKYFHSLDSKYSRMYLNIKYNIDIDKFEELYSIKQKIYNDLIKIENIGFVDGCYSFLEFLINNNKDFVIVTNTSINNINIFKEKYPILNRALKIFTKENFLIKKPNPECYLKIVHTYKNIYKKMIGFEDSLPGIQSLYQVPDIKPVFIHNNNYYYNDYIKNQYPNIIINESYNLNNLDNSIDSKCIINNEINDQQFINNIIENNINELIKHKKNIYYIIHSISIILKNKNPTNHIYLSGMGKSGYICKKSASTWQSLAIKGSYIDLPNLPHGDFGIFNNNDILLLISNGGNTKEVIDILKYIKYNLKVKINIISIVANKFTEMEKYSNMTFVLDNIIEADSINMTPSTSSLIFMSILDGIGINIRSDITKDEFKLNHPSGSLGRR
jgi:D-arabinose 5-phosphate isomerase GutQ/beta-phosphoglucomutase-like phosphatase (HAD superfamily)